MIWIVATVVQFFYARRIKVLSKAEKVAAIVSMVSQARENRNYGLNTQTLIAGVYATFILYFLRPCDIWTPSIERNGHNVRCQHICESGLIIYTISSLKSS